MVDDTVYTVIEGVDTNTGGPTSSFYGKGAVYQDVLLSDSVLVQAQAAAAAAQASADAAAASADLAGTLFLTKTDNLADLSSIPAAKVNLGLDLVSNTSDATKNSAVATLTNKTLTAPVINSPTGLVKADVGLGNVDNTSDVNKPVSTAQATADALVASNAATANALKANIASPTFTGIPAAPTPAVDTNTTQLATMAAVLAQAASASPLVNGSVAVGTSTRFARADHVHPIDTTRAPLASPTFTGVPAGPTAAVDTNTTQLATTAMVLAQAASATPLIDGTAAVGASTRFARGDHVHPTDTSRAPVASPTFTGVPAGPTATVGTNTTQLATTAFVIANAASAGVASVGTQTGALTLAGGAMSSTVIPVSRYDVAQTLTSTQQSQERANLGVLGRNRIINGQFAINQRAAAGGVTDNSYTADRWRVIGEFATANIFADNFNTAGGNVPGAALQLIGTTDKGGFCQVIRGRNCKDLRSKTVTLSMLSQVSNVRLGNMKLGIAQWAGTEDATTGDPVATWGADGVTPTLATNWSWANTPANLGVTTTSALCSVSATLNGTFNNLAVVIWNDDKTYTANDNLSVTNVQLEEGGVATPYDQRPIEHELALSLPYCEVLGAGGTINYELFCSGFALSTTVFYGIYLYPVKKVKVPTVTYSAGNTFIGNTSAGIVVGSAISTAAGSQTALQIQLSGSGFTSGGGGSLQANASSVARILIDAEI